MSPLALSLRFLQTQPDSRLVELARAGHERAFEALIQRYRRPLLNYCRRITASEAGAEDALQQALLQAWIALSTSAVEVRDARAWLYRIVHNVAVSNLRRPVHDTVEVEDAEGASGADYEVERRFAVREALAGLASLPELQRQVMLSTALEGRSHDEIATALGLSHGAVRGLIYRARATLRAAAAALTPAPLVHWAVRQQGSGAGRSAGLSEAIAGGGGAGLGGVLIKGGALVMSAGAIATAAGITQTQTHHHVRHQLTEASSLKQGSGASAGTRAGTAASVVAASLAATTRQASAGSKAGAGRGRGIPGGASKRHGRAHRADRVIALGQTPLAGSGHDGRGDGGSRSGGSGSGSGSSHHSGGKDGGSSGGGGSGGGSGSDGGSGGDHHGSGQDGSRTGTLTSGGGSGGDHGGGGEGSTLSSSTTVTSSGGGSGNGHGDGTSDGGGGGDHGGTSTPTVPTTTVTTTSTTTTGGATSGD